MSIVKQKAWLPFENEPTSTLTCELLQSFIKAIDLFPHLLELIYLLDESRIQKGRL